MMGLIENWSEAVSGFDRNFFEEIFIFCLRHCVETL